MEIDYSTIFTDDSLTIAWNKTKAKNITTKGIDEVSIKEFEANLKQNLSELKEQLKNNDYIPEPYKRIFIKKEKNKFRPIALVSVKDKIVQNAVYNSYSETFNKMFVDSSYAYRAGKGHTKAINRIKDFLSRKYTHAAIFDIDNFFDTIDRKRLFDKCATYFKDEYVKNLIKMWVYTGVVYNHKFIESNKGISQGSVISPLLSNLYLHDFDLALKNKQIMNIRYADNIIVFAKSKAEATENLKYATNYLKEYLELGLNSDFEIVEIKDGFTFCGIYFKDNLRNITSKKMDSIVSKVKNTINSNNLNEVPELLNKHLTGIEQYYLSFDTSDQIKLIEDIIAKNLTEKLKKILPTETIANVKTILRKIKFVSFRSNAEKEQLIKMIIAKARNIDLDEDNIIDKSIKKSIERKKYDYRKTWFSNLDLSVSTNFARIGKSHESISIKTNQKEQLIPIKSIKNILITGKGVTISSDAVLFASQNNLRIDYFDHFGKPYASIIHSAAPLNKVSVAQIDANMSSRSKIIMKELITAKIKNQLGVIKFFIKNKKNLDEIFTTEIKRIEDTLLQISNIDMNIDLEDFRSKIFGFEGSSASAYWNLFRMLIPNSFELETREHQNAQNVVNIILNYGYGILYSRILSAITIVGLNPNISFLHKEQGNKPVLVFDLIEQFRAPAIDRTVIALLSKNSKVSKTDNKLSETTRKLIAEKFLIRLKSEFIYRQKKTTLNDEIINQAKHLVEFLNKKANKYKPYIMKW